MMYYLYNFLEGFKENFDCEFNLSRVNVVWYLVKHKLSCETKFSFVE